MTKGDVFEGTVGGVTGCAGVDWGEALLAKRFFTYFRS